MSVVFPQAGFIVFDLGVLGIESPGDGQLLDGLKFVATRQNPQSHTPYAVRRSQNFHRNAKGVLSMQGISEKCTAQTSVDEYNAGGNTGDGSFLRIDDPDHLVLSVNGHDPGLPPFRERGEEELR